MITQESDVGGVFCCGEDCNEASVLFLFDIPDSLMLNIDGFDKSERDLSGFLK